jgi:fimbrial chaperone protein
MLSLLRGRIARLAAATATVVTLNVVAGGAAYAMRVSPMVSEISTTGTGSAARIEVGNVGSVPLPFETRITQVDFNDEGQLVETPADENFLVFPPQGVVAVGGRQVVRVQWVGDPSIDVSRAYYVAVAQLPVSTDPEAFASGGGLDLKVLYTMKALVTVAAPGAEPKVAVVSARPTMVAPPRVNVDPSLTGGVPQAAPPPAALASGVEVVVSNTGKRYALMSGATWNIEGVDPAGKPVKLQLSGDSVGEAIGVGYLAPVNGKRTFKIPTPGVEFAPDKPINVRFSK